MGIAQFNRSVILPDSAEIVLSVVDGNQVKIENVTLTNEGLVAAFVDLWLDDGGDEILWRKGVLVPAYDATGSVKNTVDFNGAYRLVGPIDVVAECDQLDVVHLSLSGIEVTP